jgi:membrane fusion protein, heavy metal efflux system
MKRLAILCATAAFLVTATSTWAAPGAHGPNGEHLDAATSAAPTGLMRLPDGSVSVPMLAQRRLGIRTKIIAPSKAQVSVELPGRVIMDPNASGRVQPTYGGRIEAGPRGLPIVGQAVKKGDVLAWVLHRPDPYAEANQRAQLAELRNARALAAKRVQRMESLEGTVPRKDIEAARAELKGFEERERSVGSGVAAKEALVAPVSGTVATAQAVAGQVVDARELLFEIVDPTRLLVEATTADTTVPSRIGSASLQEVPDAALRLLGASGALRDGVLPLTFALQRNDTAPALPVALGQPVRVIARLTNQIEGFVLPAQAVVRNAANEQVVWIKSGAERYIPQPVRVQALDANTVVITQGLGADNRVVVEAAALLAQIR